VPPEAVNVTLPHPVVLPLMTAVGRGFTVTAAEVVAVHPLLFVTVTVYVPLEVNVLAAVDTELPPLHKSDVPPLAVNETLPQAVVVPEILAVGIALTVTTCEAVAVQPAAEVTVTVYVALDVNVLVALVVALPPFHK
jgi:hypothetical protein